MNALDYLQKQNLVDESNQFYDCDLSWDSLSDKMDEYASACTESLLKENEELKAWKEKVLGESPLTQSKAEEIINKRDYTLLHENSDLQSLNAELLSELKGLVENRYDQMYDLKITTHKLISNPLNRI